MTNSRRSVLTAGAAAAALATVGAPYVARAQARPARQVRMVPHGNLAILDPIWTTQNMAAYHGAMMYDTLFGIDANFNPQPQMVGKTDISADRKTYTFELRPGLKWHDGSAVTARDCVASLRRWQVKDGAGTHLWARVADTPVVDEKTFRSVLKEPYGLLLDALAKTSTPVCFRNHAATTRLWQNSPGASQQSMTKLSPPRSVITRRGSSLYRTWAR